MENIFRKIITRLGQGPRILLWPLGLHFLPLWAKVGIAYKHIWDNPYAILMLFAILMSYTGGSIIKLLFFKTRPIPYVYSNRLQRINASSFPSIHTSNATVISLICAWWGHQSIVAGSDRMSIVPLLVGVMIIASGIALSRIALHKHYPIDVRCGILFGILIVGLLGLAFMYKVFYWWYI